MSILTYDKFVEDMEKIRLKLGVDPGGKDQTVYTHIAINPIYLERLRSEFTPSKFSSFLGMNIIEHKLTKTVQAKFPRCNKKKRRIVKRFRRKYTVEIPDPNIYLINTNKLRYPFGGL